VTARKLESWIDGFLEYTSGLPSPKIWRKWTGIATLAGAIERKIWTVNSIGQVHATLYIIIVGPPGTGKTLLTSTIQDFWYHLKDLHAPHSDLTGASLKDRLREAERRVVRPNCQPSILSFNSIAIAVNELSILIKGFDPELMHILTDIYDGKRFGESRRGKDLTYSVDHPQINLVAATNPHYLNAILPEGAWSEGFASRLCLIYSGEKILAPIFKMRKANVELKESLIHDLKIIHGLIGNYQFEDGAADAIENWHMAGGPPAPTHPKLLSYNSRRTYLLLKLCLIAAASESNEPVITVDHYNIALEWMLEAEEFMPDIFKSFAQGGDSVVIGDLHYFIEKTQIKERTPGVIEARVFSFLQQRVPSHNIAGLLTAMQNAGFVRLEIDNKLGKIYRALQQIKY
jgi:hypothetical protein